MTFKRWLDPFSSEWSGTQLWISLLLFVCYWWLEIARNRQLNFFRTWVIRLFRRSVSWCRDICSRLQGFFKLMHVYFQRFSFFNWLSLNLKFSVQRNNLFLIWIISLLLFRKNKLISALSVTFFRNILAKRPFFWSLIFLFLLRVSQTQTYFVLPFRLLLM